MKKICICGSFGFGRESLNGQTIKTEIITDYYRSVYGDEEVSMIDTQGVKNILLLPLRLFFAFLNSKNVIILPAYNALRVVAPLCGFFQLFFGKKTHYFVIGGWLANYLKRHRIVASSIKRFAGIYAETSTLKNALTKMGYDNIIVIPNFKHLTINEDVFKQDSIPPLKLCTFSRICEMKGIGDAVDAVNSINNERGADDVSLDIYGRVDEDPGVQEWFDDLKKSFGSSIHFRGAIRYDKSVETLKDYHILLFPTRYYTEGIPGTIIDAYATGLPVIASCWESGKDIIVQGETGVLYTFDDNDALKKSIVELLDNPDRILSMRKECINAARNYLPDKALEGIVLK